METIDFVLTNVSEPLDEMSGERLRNMIRRRLRKSKLVHIVDLRMLTGLDSRTLAQLIRSLRIVLERGGSVGLLINQREVLKILTINGLDRVFPIYHDEAEAFGALWTSNLIPA
jgi:anti-anti-sigma factor